jgi:hypothetical protein
MASGMVVFGAMSFASKPASMSQMIGVVSRSVSSIEPSVVQTLSMTSNGFSSQPKRFSVTFRLSKRSACQARMLQRTLSSRPWRILRSIVLDARYWACPEKVTAA